MSGVVRFAMAQPILRIEYTDIFSLFVGKQLKTDAESFGYVLGRPGIRVVVFCPAMTARDGMGRNVGMG